MLQIHRLLSKHFGSFLESKTFNVQDNKTANVGGSYIQIRMRVRRPKPLRQNGNEGNSRYVQWSVSLSVCLSAIQSVHQLICLHPFCLSICLSVCQSVSSLLVGLSVNMSACLSLCLSVSHWDTQRLEPSCLTDNPECKLLYSGFPNNADKISYTEWLTFGKMVLLSRQTETEYTGFVLCKRNMVRFQWTFVKLMLWCGKQVLFWGEISVEVVSCVEVQAFIGGCGLSECNYTGEQRWWCPTYSVGWVCCLFSPCSKGVSSGFTVLQFSSLLKTKLLKTQHSKFQFNQGKVSTWKPS